ncbi:hypothetical protein [Nocardia harenae]|uniref:hypothetical protein n=1 Tax=Nocardia harenae TaxID=358707 RepID=UPI000830FCB2|nr:hypothetical protein [Nocardia harenae]
MPTDLAVARDLEPVAGRALRDHLRRTAFGVLPTLRRWRFQDRELGPAGERARVGLGAYLDDQEALCRTRAALPPAVAR